MFLEATVFVSTPSVRSALRARYVPSRACCVIEESVWSEVRCGPELHQDQRTLVFAPQDMIGVARITRVDPRRKLEVLIRIELIPVIGKADPVGHRLANVVFDGVYPVEDPFPTRARDTLLPLLGHAAASGGVERQARVRRRRDHVAVREVDMVVA